MKLCKSILAFFLLSLNACTNNDSLAPNNLYFDYRVFGEESNSLVTVLLQFKAEGENGSPQELPPPGKVELDGEMIPPHSSRLTGTYYEIQKPISRFSGRHIILLTNINDTEYRETFVFQPLSLINDLGTRVFRQDIILKLGGLVTGDKVRILMSDTSFTGEGINKIVTPENGRVLISKKELDRLLSGPINLEVIKENDRGIKDRTSAEGRLFISFMLKREFLLMDSLSD